jgi:hypothetical protein
VAGYCEHGNELSGFKKGGEFLNWVSDINFSRGALLDGVTQLVDHAINNT